MEVTMKSILLEFHRIFKYQHERIFFSPGRVNLIGEHIDYNGGLVFPAAISLGTYGAIKKRTDQRFRFYSANFKEQGVIDIEIDQLAYLKDHGWANYAKGILFELRERQYSIPFGFDLYIEGNLPPQSGLSSSASLEVLVGYIANQLYDLGLTRTDIALLGQHVENYYMGMHCGIMDQLIIANGIKDHGILMNTDTLEMTKANAFFKGYRWLIMNSNYKRKTTESKYNERVSECNLAQKIIIEKKVIRHLCELSIEDLKWIEPLIHNDTIYKRVRHVITEQDRTLQAKKAMEAHDANAFAKLLDGSHKSLKEDYEVTGLHLDTLVEEAKKAGAMGARVTGAGFGGCAIALVPDDLIEDVKTKVGVAYFNKTNIPPDFYLVNFEDGVKEIALDYLKASLKYFVQHATDLNLFPANEKDARLKKLSDLLHVCIDDTILDFDMNLDHALQLMIDRGYTLNLFSPNTTEERDAFEAYLYDFVMEEPKVVKQNFKDKYLVSPDFATQYLYQLSKDVNYIKSERLKQNTKWRYEGTYGPLEITINLAKPEKDPRDIAKAKDLIVEGRPKCVLCKENEHNYWNARMNLRIVPIILGGELWHFQYSPYLYYDEHAIILHDEHRLMKITDKTMDYLFDFVDQFPSYFIGSNADLPIVGGSILNHDHFQGGKYHFPIEEAKTIKTYRYQGIVIEILHWPLSTVRLKSNHRETLKTIVEKIYQAWKAYRNEALEIIPWTKDTPHQTITPIVRKNEGHYEVDLILRNNRTNEIYPDGIFHPHPDVHHIKKENIGLIEAMGLAILPGRLKEEMIYALDYLSLGVMHPSIDKHLPWLDTLQDKKIHSFEQIQVDIGRRFEKVIEDSGVFKQNKEGIEAFQEFIESCIKK
jgi:galactose-1-phosphate uridylyltransferase family 2/galactokinase